MTVTALLRELADLVWPRTCVGCAAPGVTLCAGCRGRDAVAVLDDLAAVVDVPVLAAARYAGGVRRAVIACKSHHEHGRRDLVAVLAPLLRAAVDALLALTGVGVDPDASPFLSPSWGSVIVVPVPSAAAAARARGGQHVARLARAAAPSAVHGRDGPLVREMLRASPRRHATAGLSAAGRVGPRPGFRVLARPGPGPVRPVVLVDDVVTTGATVRDAVAALRGAGWPVLGAAVVAATPRRVPVLPPAARAAPDPVHPDRS